MAKGPRFLDLDNRPQRHELTSAFLRRDGDVVYGDLMFAGGRLLAVNGQAVVRIDASGQRFTDPSGATVFDFDSTTGSLTITGTITGSTITGGTFQTATSGKRVVIASPPGDRVSFFSGDADETAEGYLSVGVQGSGGSRAWVGTLTTGQISSQDRAAVVLISESKDGSSLKTNVTLSADNVLVTATTTSADSTIQLQGDLALFDSYSDPPVASASYVRIYNSAGESLKTISPAATAPLAPQRVYVGVPSASITASTTPTRPTGMYVQPNTKASSAIYHAVGTVRFNPDGVTIGEVMVLDLVVNSTLVTSSVFTNLTTLSYNWPLTVNYAGTLVTPGVQTIELKASRLTVTSGTVTVGGTDGTYGMLSVSLVG